jgi:hypothetical protein
MDAVNLTILALSLPMFVFFLLQALWLLRVSKPPKARRPRQGRATASFFLVVQSQA